MRPPTGGYGQQVHPPAVLFDIDGTLVDTNYLHSLAWRRAFLEVGLDVPTSGIHHRIGMGAGDLMEGLVGEARDDVKKAWRRQFDRLKPEVRAIPGAAELLRHTKRAGATVVLASSSEEEDVEALVDAIDARDAIDHVTSAGDVEEAKPSPEVFEAAIEKARCDRRRVLAVGDTVWDVQAAAKAGIDCVCVLTGGIGRGQLEEAGAVAVYPDVRALLEQFDASPLGRLLADR